MKKILIGIICGIIMVIPTKTLALNEVNVYFFHSESCNFCNQEKAYLEALKERYFNLRVYSYDVSSEINNDLMKQAKELYGVKEAGIPFTIIGDSTFLGFSESKKCDMEEKIYEYSYNSYQNLFGTKLLMIGYRTDLVGDVEKSTDKKDYVIEESRPITTADATNSNQTTAKSSKFQITLNLGMVILILGIIVLVLIAKERKRNI
ncbi:MAG: hypothetical protein PUB18_04470 [bacterium]|nr:hypothetical protein [bacterium]